MLKNPKGPPFQFFGIETFFEILFFLQRVPPLNAKKDNFRKCPPFSAPGGRATRPIFLVFRFGHLEVLWLFLSLGYGADLDRSRLVLYFYKSQFHPTMALFTVSSDQNWSLSSTFRKNCISRFIITTHEPHRTSKILLVRFIANKNALF